MAGSREIRVSVGHLCAAVALKDQRHFGLAWSLADGLAEIDFTLWFWPGSSTGKGYDDSKQRKQSLDNFLPFSAQDVSLKMDLGTLFHCFRRFASNLPDPNQYWAAAFSPARVSSWKGSIACVYRKKNRQSVPLAPLGKLWGRSVTFWQSSNRLFEDQAWGHLSRGITRHAEDEITRQHLDLQDHSDFESILGLKDKGELYWLEKDAQSRIEQNIPLLPPSWLDPAKREPHKTDLLSLDVDLIQIFIKTTEGKHHCMRLSKGSSSHGLKKEIQGYLGTPTQYQNLIYAGYSLQDKQTLQQYGITKDSTIILNLRLRGGSTGTSSKNTGSFRDAVKGKEKMKNKEAPPSEAPGPYIVEQKPKSPMLQVSIPEVTSLHSDLCKNAVICRFNGFWPKSDALHQWIYTTWTSSCEINLCPKGYFIVRFNTEQERDSVINQGPWLWGSVGLFLTPWFPDFDANTMKVSTMPVWVRLHGLPLHFWHHKVFAANWDSLGKFLKMDEDRAIRGIFTFARICVEVDLSQGLPDHIKLNFNNTQWIQQLDYENTTFWCRGCMQTGHLQYDCPFARKDIRKTKKQQKKPKGWQHTEPMEEEVTIVEPTENQTELDTQMRQTFIQEEGAPATHSGPHIPDLQREPQMEISGIKRTHGSEGSESDKELQLIPMENQLSIISPTPDSGGWRRVEKKKGRKV